MTLPRVEVGGWDFAGAAAAARVLVGAAVVPWRPGTGAYVLMERGDAAPTPDPDGLRALVGVPGVAGAWTWTGSEPRHPRLGATVGLTLTVCYLDGPPVDVAEALRPVLDGRWADGRARRCWPRRSSRWCPAPGIATSPEPRGGDRVSPSNV